MRPELIAAQDADTAPVSLGRFLVALDASDHADRALAESLRVVDRPDGVITGIHAYAARMHDVRFRQMEGGLPDRYLDEEEMDYQRDVHDDLITRGLEIISDSYHDVAGTACEDAGLEFRRLSPEGKNYRRIVEAAKTGEYDVIALGAIGLGAVPGSTIGTVCERVVRRSPVDTLVIRDSELALGDGPIVVAIDGSSRSFGALKTGLKLGRLLGCEVRAVAAYDPYYHYVAFNKIAGVLSDEAGKVFRFKEQEQLHEELIDDGIAKIYQSHLDVARRIASEEEGVEIACDLVDGKIYRAILDYVERVGASLLMVGKVGIHADSRLDIGGNAENLLRLAPCHMWLGQATYTPPFDVVAEETISWSHEAEAMLAKAPDFVRGMARTAVLRHAQEKGHTFVTSDIVQEVAFKMMPGRREAGEVAEQAPLVWSDEAAALIEAECENAVAANMRLRAEKRARRDGAATVLPEHVRPFLEREQARRTDTALPWAAAALARIARVPEPMQAATRERIEAVARERGAAEVTLEIVEAGLVAARKAMHEAMLKGGHKQTREDEDTE